MIATIRVKTNSPKQEIECLGENKYSVKLKSEPEQNKANKELINMISKLFKTPVGKIKIIRGAHDKNKILRVN